MRILTVLLLHIPFTLGGIATIWERFWDVSCEYASPVTREKRSTIEDVDVNEPEDLFNYLYPLAHLTPDDLRNESQRSAYPPPTLATWAADIIEFWEYECHLRSDAEDADDLDEVEIGESEDDIDMPEDTTAPEFVPGNSSLPEGQTPRTRLGKSSRVHGNYYGPRAGAVVNRGMPPVSTNEGGYFGVPLPNGGGARTNKRPRKKLRRKQDRQSPGDPSTTTTTTAAPEASTKAEPEQFFSSYGGDIEYFFPLIGFGIPFDGEITFLGFHGFKGLFPYK